MNPYFHVRKEDVHAGSACDVNPPFESFDVVLRHDYEKLFDTLKRIVENAQAWHGDDAAKGRALARLSSASRRTGATMAKDSVADRLELFMLDNHGEDVYDLDAAALTSSNFRRVIRDKKARELVNDVRRAIAGSEAGQGQEPS